MAMDLEKLKKIPLFKNADFEDPRTKKRLALFFAAAAMMLLVIIVNIAMPSKRDAPATAQDKYDTVFIEMPEGVDNDILAEEDMLSVHQRMTPGNRDIFMESRPVNQDNPLAFLDKDKDDALTGGRRAETKEEREAMAMAAFGLSDEGAASGTQEEPPTGAVVDALNAATAAPGALKDALAEGTASRMTPADAKGGKKSREEIEAQEERENRGASAKKTTPASGGRRTLADAERQKRDGNAVAQDVREEPQEETRRAVRRSGGISSLDGEWGTIEGISSLDSESQYVTEDSDHPYKVMFTRDQKIKSGDRITLRLMEDMAVDGVLIPKNTHLTATCQIGERLQILVTNIELGGRIYALNYTAYDNDGSQGLYCPISGATQAKDKGTSNATQAASSLISSAASIAGAAMGSSALGNIIGNAANIGASAVTSRNGSVTAQVNSGYTFYLLKN